MWDRLTVGNISYHVLGFDSSEMGSKYIILAQSGINDLAGKSNGESFILLVKSSLT